MKMSKKTVTISLSFGAIYVFIVHRLYQIRIRDAGFGVGEETHVCPSQIIPVVGPGNAIA